MYVTIVINGGQEFERAREELEEEKQIEENYVIIFQLQKRSLRPRSNKGRMMWKLSRG